MCILICDWIGIKLKFNWHSLTSRENHFEKFSWKFWSLAARYIASPVVTATGLVACQWERAMFDPLQNQHPSTDHKKFVTGDYVGDPYDCAKLGAYPSTGGFWAHNRNYFYSCPFWGTHLQVRPVDGFSRGMAQTKRTRAMMCLFKNLLQWLPIYGSWIGVFKPN